MKILIDVKSGMNDCVSMLNYMLQYCHKNNISYDNIYFRSVLYEFSNYFDINTINYIKSDVIPKVELFNKLILVGKHVHTLKNIDKPYHVSNFLRLKNDIIKNHNEYNDYVAIHCRALYDNNYSDFLNKYINKIEKIISENEKVCIFSDTDKIFNHLPSGKNIIHEKTGVRDMTSWIQRKASSHIAVDHIVKIGKCKQVYTTKGGFCKLAKAFVNKNLPITNISA